jgi:hypothetical protein
MGCSVAGAVIALCDSSSSSNTAYAYVSCPTFSALLPLPLSLQVWHTPSMAKQLTPLQLHRTQGINDNTSPLTCCTPLLPLPSPPSNHFAGVAHPQYGEAAHPNAAAQEPRHSQYIIPSNATPASPPLSVTPAGVAHPQYGKAAHPYAATQDLRHMPRHHHSPGLVRRQQLHCSRQQRPHSQGLLAKPCARLDPTHLIRA